MKNKPSSTLSPDWRSYVRWAIKVDSWPHKAQRYITVKSSIYILRPQIVGDMVEIKKRGEMHPWVSSLLRGWGCERRKGARKASNSWGGGRVSFVLLKHCFQPQDEKGDGQLTGILTVSLLPTLVSHCALQPSTPLFTRPVNDITITWYPSPRLPHRLFYYHYFHNACRPSGNEKTGARRQMFGEMIDLR